MIFLVPWSMMIATALLRPSQVDHIVGLLNHLVVAQHQRLSDRDAAPGCQSTATRDTLKRASLSSSRLGNQHRAEEPAHVPRNVRRSVTESPNRRQKA